MLVSNCKSIQMGRHVDVIEMDGASKTGVNDIREIIETVVYRAASAKFKVYIIDEVHMLSNSAFNALLKTLEEPPEHVKFIFATTEIKKIPLTILSRVNRFDLKRLEIDVLMKHLLEILQREGLKAEKEALKTISREAAGSVRDALSILDQVLVNCETIIENQLVNELLGKVSKLEILSLLELIIQGNTKEALKRARSFIAGNTSPALLLQELLECLHFTSVSSLMDNELIGDDYSSEEKKLAQKLSNGADTVILTSLWQILFKGIDELKVASEPITSLEMLLFRACHMSIMPSPDALINSVLANESDGKMHLYNLESKSSLKTLGKDEIVNLGESKTKNTELNKSDEATDSSTVKEILDIFPGATVKK
ncbi:MAG: DNA polymerase III subunit gamma/tau [Paracoccaceae bacterium]